MITDVEYWVMKVIGTRAEVRAVEAGETWKGLTQREITERLNRGDLAYCGNELCEPIECYTGDTGQQQAIDRAAREHSRTGVVHKVVLNAEL